MIKFFRFTKNGVPFPAEKRLHTSKMGPFIAKGSICSFYYS